jgi:O-antigen chain-terminating methyltransferase
MDTFEINDEEIDVEKIMAQIRENIRNRKAEGSYPEVRIETIPPLPKKTLGKSTDIQQDLAYINENWDIQNNTYVISSHRPVAGKILVKGRELIHDEVKRYVDPVIWKQTEFNGGAVRSLNSINEKIDTFEGIIDSKIDKIIFGIDDTILNELRPEIDNKINALRPEIDNKINAVRPEIEDQIFKQFNSFISSVNSDIENKAWLASIFENRIKEGYENLELVSSGTKDADINYFVFEEQFRGSRDVIKQRQADFLCYFEQCSKVLDIGCGRGEFLELLKENGINACGVDLNKDMVDYCHSKDLDVEQQDAITYLENIEDKSLDGIFIDQVVEHLEPEYLVRLLKLCYQKLKYGYHLVAETVNPLSLVSFANFYIDMTHKKPIHPETLKFLFGSVGFRDIDARFFSPVSDDSRLKKMPTDETANLKDRAFFEVYNHNMELLNNILFGAQDYAVIGKK